VAQGQHQEQLVPEARVISSAQSQWLETVVAVASLRQTLAVQVVHLLVMVAETAVLVVVGMDQQHNAVAVVEQADFLVLEVTAATEQTTVLDLLVLVVEAVAVAVADLLTQVDLVVEWACWVKALTVPKALQQQQTVAVDLVDQVAAMLFQPALLPPQSTYTVRVSINQHRAFMVAVVRVQTILLWQNKPTARLELLELFGVLVEHFLLQIQVIYKINF
jgi:hypothetical protein